MACKRSSVRVRLAPDVEISSEFSVYAVSGDYSMCLTLTLRMERTAL